MSEQWAYHCLLLSCLKTSQPRIVQHRWRNSPHCCNSQPCQALAGGSMILFVYLQMADSLLCFCSAATDGFACGCRGFNLLCASLLGLLECSLLRWCSTISMSESVTRCSGSTWRLHILYSIILSLSIWAVLNVISSSPFVRTAVLEDFKKDHLISLVFWEEPD